MIANNQNNLFVKVLIEQITSKTRNDVSALKKNGKAKWTNYPVTEKRLLKHLEGAYAVGVCPIKEGGSTVKLAVLDFDSHKGETPWVDMVEVVLKITTSLSEHGLYPIVFRSSGGKGIHAYIVWNEDQDAYSVRRYLTEILNKNEYSNGTKGVANKEIEIFPKQDHVPVGGKGNQFILPLAGLSVPLDLNNNLATLDKQAFLNIEWKASSPVPVYEKVIKPASLVSGTDKKEIPEMLKLISSEDRGIWILIGQSLYNIYNGSAEGMSIWLKWSQTASTYKDEDDIIKTWASFKIKEGGQVGIGTIRHHAYKGGYQPDVSDQFDDISSQFDSEPKKEYRFKLTQAAEFAETRNISWAIKNILPKYGLAMAYGESGSGKTFFILDICFAVSRGVNWKDYKVKQPYKVVYIAAEGANGVGQRLVAYSICYGVDLKDLPFMLITESPNLTKNDDEQLIEDIKAQGGTDIIIIDTLAQVTPGANENTGEDMNPVIKRCQNLMNQLNCLVVLIHHCGKDKGRGARGWSGMKGALDTEIQVSKNGTEMLAEITKQKDGIDGLKFAFNLQSVEIGKDEDGDPITSCIVHHLDQPMIQIPKVFQGKNEKYIMDYITSVASFDSEPLSLNDIVSHSTILIKKASNGKAPRKSSVERSVESLVDKDLLVKTEKGYVLAQMHKLAQSADCEDEL